MMAKASVSIVSGNSTAGQPRLIVVQGGEKVEVGIRLPLVLLREVRDLVVELPAEEVILRGWPGSGTSAIEFFGESRIRVKLLRFEVKHVYVGARGEPASCHLQADEAVGDQQIVPPDVRTGSVLRVKGVFENRYPWFGIAVVERTLPTDDPVWQFLAECNEKLPEGVPPVVMSNYDLPTDTNMDWARKHGDLFPKLLKALVAEGLAKGERIGTKGTDPKMRVRPNLRWGDLRAAYENPDQMDSRIRRVFERLK